MRALIQRVSFAKVEIVFSPKSSAENNIDSRSREISKGLLIFVAFKTSDTDAELEWMAKKIIRLRIFNDEQGKLNLSLEEIKGELLIVSQFTLYADSRKGNRPSFEDSASPSVALPLYEKFLQTVRTQFTGKVTSGEFGVEMRVHLLNDGPVTILLEKEFIVTI